MKIGEKDFKLETYKTKTEIYIDGGNLSKLFTKENAKEIIEDLKNIALSEVEKQYKYTKETSQVGYGNCSVHLSLNRNDGVTVEVTYDDRENDRIARLNVNAYIDLIEEMDEEDEEYNDLVEVILKLDEHRKLTEQEVNRIERQVQ